MVIKIVLKDKYKSKWFRWMFPKKIEVDFISEKTDRLIRRQKLKINTRYSIADYTPLFAEEQAYDVYEFLKEN